MQTYACQICPRNCQVDRRESLGYCQVPESLLVSRAALHMWEEPCISGENGSGTVFFSGCNMGCVFCQNKAISRGQTGKMITIERLAQIFIELQEQGANNINLVTPTHYVPSIIKAIDLARTMGIQIPFVYNTGSYESVETLRSLEGYIDIYLPDFKYMDETLSKKYSNVKDYSFWAKAAIDEMVRQVGNPVFNNEGIMKSGVIVRHLILPGCKEDSKRIIHYLYERYRDDIYISIMNQYTPMDMDGKYPELERKVTASEYDEVVDDAIDLGVENGFIQEGETQSESFIPSFDGIGV